MTTDRTNRYSRRDFLARMGLGLGMLPLLNSDKAIGQTAGVAKRLITITWANGIVPENFYPPAGPLTTPLPPILASLEPWKAKVLAMRGPGVGDDTGGVDSRVMVDANMTYNGHLSYPSLLTGAVPAASGLTNTAAVSIDTLISDQLKSQGFPTPQLNLGCRPGVSGTSYRAGGVKNASETSPSRLYTRLFGGGAVPPPADLLFARRKSVIDFCIDDLTRFGARLGAEDKIKIDAHFEAIRSIERQLGSTPPPPAGCSVPPAPPPNVNFNQNANYPLLVKLMIDMIAAAVRCDLARTFTLDLIDPDGNNQTFPWLGIPSPDYWTIAHGGTAYYPQKTAIDAWFYAQVADLVGQLAANPEGGATSLDNSVVLVCNGMNVGGIDAVTSLPYLIIGSGAGFFKQGTCVQFPVNVPNNQLLTSVCHAMDLQVPSVGMTYLGDLDGALRA